MTYAAGVDILIAVMHAKAMPMQDLLHSVKSRAVQLGIQSCEDGGPVA